MYANVIYYIINDIKYKYVHMYEYKLTQMVFLYSWTLYTDFAILLNHFTSDKKLWFDFENIDGSTLFFSKIVSSVFCRASEV